jgi:hypothetical protein
MIVHVPVSPAVKKYFLNRYKNLTTIHNARSALELNKKSFLGNFIYMILNRDLSNWELKPPPKDCLVLILPKNCDKYWLDTGTTKRLSYYLDRLMKEEMCFYINIAHRVAKISALQAVDNFCRDFGIEENDYGQDDIYRYYTRYGKFDIRPTKSVA